MENRKFKFRAWILDEMVSENLYPEYVFDAHCYDYPIMQCTGLKDSKGREIWEGDLIKCDFDDNTRKSNYVVVWIRAGFYLACQTEKEKPFFEALARGVVISEKLIVVGNRFEHPEKIEHQSNIQL